MLLHSGIGLEADIVVSEMAHDIKEYGEELVGCKIKVWWPLDQKFYEGVVNSFDPIKKQHMVVYADGDEEILDLRKEHWKLATEEESKNQVRVFNKARNCCLLIKEVEELLPTNPKLRPNNVAVNAQMVQALTPFALLTSQMMTHLNHVTIKLRPNNEAFDLEAANLVVFWLPILILVNQEQMDSIAFTN